MRPLAELASGPVLQFPDLQERAVDVVYDLCEDEDSAVSCYPWRAACLRSRAMVADDLHAARCRLQVRRSGYACFALLSASSPAWIQRNTDVLSQLLAVDAAAERAQIRGLIGEHVRLAPAKALGVVFDVLEDAEAGTTVQDELFECLREGQLTSTGTDWEAAFREGGERVRAAAVDNSAASRPPRTDNVLTSSHLAAAPLLHQGHSVGASRPSRAQGARKAACRLVLDFDRPCRPLTRVPGSSGGTLRVLERRLQLARCKPPTRSATAHVRARPAAREAAVRVAAGQLDLPAGRGSVREGACRFPWRVGYAYGRHWIGRARIDRREAVGGASADGRLQPDAEDAREWHEQPG